MSYLERKDAALKRKTARRTPVDTKAAKKDHANAQLATKIVDALLSTARKNAHKFGLNPAKKAADKPPEK